MGDATKRPRKAKPAKLSCCAVFRHTEAIWTFCKSSYGHTEPHADHRGNRWSKEVEQRRGVWQWEPRPEETNL